MTQYASENRIINGGSEPVKPSGTNGASTAEPGTRNPEPYCPPALGGGGGGMSDGANRGSISSRIDR